MRKRIASILLIAAMLIAALPAGVFAASPTEKLLESPSVYYTPASDYKSGDCILTATKIMIRRASIMRGSKVWSSITNKTLRKSATIRGLLLNAFSFEADGISYKVVYGRFTGRTDAERIREFEQIIRQHPEGVVVHGLRASIYGMHGVLLVDVRNGVPYVADSVYNTGNVNRGIQKWSQSSMKSPRLAYNYWYIKEVGPSKKTKVPKGKPLAPASATNVSIESTLMINGPAIPENVKLGGSFIVRGLINSNYRIKEVTVGVYDKSGKAVIKKKVKPEKWTYDINDIDRYLRFGIIPSGTYKYRITAKDEKTSLTLVDKSFTVSLSPTKLSSTPQAVNTANSAASVLRIVSYTTPDRIVQGKGFSIKGKIKSPKKIKKVTVQIIDSNGNKVQTITKKPNKKSYNLSKIDAKVRFGKLSRGGYTFKITAKDSGGKKTLVNKQFTVI